MLLKRLETSFYEYTDRSIMVLKRRERSLRKLLKRLETSLYVLTDRSIKVLKRHETSFYVFPDRS